MIAVKLWGGLGNQMFQYAFGHFLARNRNEKPVFFNEGHQQNQEQIAISNFNVSLNLLTYQELKKLGYVVSNSFFYRIKRKLIQYFPFVNKAILVEKELNYLSNIKENYSLFDGYWQSYKYLEPIEDKLRADFTFHNNVISNIDLYNNICNEISISLHIRRGDYLVGKNAKIYESCPLNYYLTAVRQMKERFISPVFYVFSNDLEWAKNHLKVPNDVQLRFVDNSDCSEVAIADLFLMSSCKHHIIANSTFSWWGAWLNPSKEKKIIAPAKWYVGTRNKTTKDLIPPEWDRL